MSFLLWWNEITLILLIGESCNANLDCKIISSCEMQCQTGRPFYDCNRRELLEVPSFPETTELLDLSYNAIKTLYSDTFADYLNLSSLDLSNNYLTSLPAAVFLNNVALQYLVIWNNNLTSLPEAVFMNNVALEYIDLDGNSLTTLPLNLFSPNIGLLRLHIAGNPIDNIETHLFDNHNDLGLLMVFCEKCFDCDCLPVSTYEWITKRVTDLLFYEFTCRNGVSLPNTVVNCSDDGLRLAVTIMQNESSCNCKKPISMKSSSTDLINVATRAMESTIDKVQRKTKTKDSSYTYITVIISGMAASITLIASFKALRMFIDTTSRIRHSDLKDTEHNNTINDGIDFINIKNCNVQMDNEYNNIPPKSHMNPSNDGTDFIEH